MTRIAWTLCLLAVLGGGYWTAGYFGLVETKPFNAWVGQAEALLNDQQATPADTANTSIAPTATGSTANEKTAQPDATTKLSGPAVSVARVTPKGLVDSRLLTGSLVAREEILITPEIDRVRIVEIHVEEGDDVKKGQRLAVLQDALIKTQLDENTAALKRIAAQKRQADSALVEANAVLNEAEKAFQRAKPLKSSGYLSESLYDQRQTALSTARARKSSAIDGQGLIEAQRAELEAKRREIEWRLSKTNINAPTAGRIAKRNARIGQFVSGPAEPLFRIIEDGEVEMEADVEDTQIGQLKVGMSVDVTTASSLKRKGSVRLISPMIDTTTRLGKIRVALGRDADLKIGSFARATVEIARTRSLAVPASALLYTDTGPAVHRVVDNIVRTTPVKIGLSSGGFTGIIEGLSDGDLVVTKAGTFLRDGDKVRPIQPAPRLSAADQVKTAQP